MVNTYSLVFALAAVLAVSAPAFADEGADGNSLFAREDDMEVYSRAPSADELTELFSRGALGDLKRYRTSSKHLNKACKKIKASKDRKQCRKELKAIKASKNNRKTKITELDKATTKWRKHAVTAAKSAHDYRKAVHRLSRTCKKAKGSEAAACQKQLEEIQSGNGDKKTKASKLSKLMDSLSKKISKHKASKKQSKAYRKQLKALHSSCRKLDGADKKACYKEYKAIKHSKDKKAKKIDRTEKAIDKFQAKEELEEELDDRSFDEEFDARDFADVESRSVETEAMLRRAYEAQFVARDALPINDLD